MDGAWMETREVSLPKHYWERIEADPEVRDGELTVEEWIRRLIRSRFGYSASLDLADHDEGEMENNNRDAGELLPGLKKGVKHLGRLHTHGGGIYAERDAGRREGIQSAEQHLQMLINQIEESQEKESKDVLL